ncbi:hypothetical protein T492DRAFT_832114 [Pavlovales sp. CCMP2436]|nr:hypothetical protein T492DRAFT_832114 [Pavlovales sp. CCMP2436]
MPEFPRLGGFIALASAPAAAPSAAAATAPAASARTARGDSVLPLSAESFCERVLSVAKLVINEGKTSLSSKTGNARHPPREPQVHGVHARDVLRAQPVAVQRDDCRFR